MGEVLVFDCDGGGKAILDYLEDEMPVDISYLKSGNWYDFEKMSSREIYDLVKRELTAYIGRYKAIVLASPTVSVVVKERLEKEYPRQKFVGCGGAELIRELKGVRSVVMLIPEKMKRVREYQQLKARCQKYTIIEPNCERWSKLLDDGWMGVNKLRVELGEVNGSRVVIYHPGIMEKTERLQEVFGWRGELIDARKEILKGVKAGLGMVWNG